MIIEILFIITPRSGSRLGYSQYHLAVAGGCEAVLASGSDFAPTHYREVVLTSSNLDSTCQNQDVV
jgi:hypothetical protein